MFLMAVSLLPRYVSGLLFGELFLDFSLEELVCILSMIYLKDNILPNFKVTGINKRVLVVFKHT